MKEKEIEIIYDENLCEVTVETTGFTGEECKKTTKNLEAHLGSVKERQTKAEGVVKLKQAHKEKLRSLY